MLEFVKMDEHEIASSLGFGYMLKHKEKIQIKRGSGLYDTNI